MAVEDVEDVFPKFVMSFNWGQVKQWMLTTDMLH